jgi:hypothetical protein
VTMTYVLNVLGQLGSTSYLLKRQRLFLFSPHAYQC